MKAQRKLKILCVDDEALLLEIMGASVAHLGYEVLTAPDGLAAMEIIKREHGRLVLVLSDYSMPGATGFDLRKSMLGDFRHIPFVMISGHVTRESALEAVDLKISGFLEKPFEIQRLIDVIQRESKDRVTAINDEDELIEGFAGEAEGILEEMEGLILVLEDAPQDVDSINRLMACAHTIKGTSGYFQPDTLHRFTHRFEDYILQFKKGQRQIDASIISVFLKATDTLKKLIEDLCEHRASAVGIDELLKIFSLEAIKAHAETPEIQVSGDAAKTTAAKAPTANASAEELRVSVQVLNQFMEKSGELTVLRNMVNKALRVIEAQYPTDPNVGTLTNLLGEMHKVNGTIQEQVVDLRKVALKQVFKPLVRTCRDLSVNLKKKLELVIEGDDLRVDHRIADVFSKCLIHLLRNSADHGIENPEERKLAGKDPTGHIFLTAQDLGEEIVVRLADDGRGLNLEKIRSKAIEKNLVTDAQCAAMNESDLSMLIFEPGFSTADQVTDVSGRGVGTDMVRGTILSVGGRITVRTRAGQGTEFIFHLPVPKSVLIINSLMIKVGDQVLALPQESVVRVLQLDEESRARHIQRIASEFVYQEQDRLLPILNLKNILQGTNEREAPRLLVCVQGTHSAYCLQVDEVLDIEDTVVKQTGTWFRDLDIYSGATFLADGRIGLILSVDGLAQKAAQLVTPPSRTSNLSLVTKSEPGDLVLLFDLGTESQYGIRQSEIFRLEEFSPTQIRYTGHQPVLIYRNQTVPLINLKKLLTTETVALADQTGEMIQTLIVENDQRLLAFAVSHINDFAELSGQEEASILTNEEHQVCIVQKKTVTLLNARHLVQQHFQLDPTGT